MDSPRRKVVSSAAAEVAAVLCFDATEMRTVLKERPSPDRRSSSLCMHPFHGKWRVLPETASRKSVGDCLPACRLDKAARRILRPLSRNAFQVKLHTLLIFARGQAQTPRCMRALQACF